MRCKAKTQSGKPCQAKALKDNDFCFAHAPEVGTKRAMARKRGGERHRTPHGGNPDTLPREVKTLNDANHILIYVLDEVIPMENSIARARVLLSLHDSYVKALQIGELEQRLAALEQALKAR